MKSVKTMRSNPNEEPKCTTNSMSRRRKNNSGTNS